MQNKDRLWAETEDAEALTAASFLPETARRHFASSPLDKDSAQHISGSVLFCDLSGFSRMGATAVALSERGAEVLQGMIDAIFAEVAKTIETHGGAILYYAGDAVAALFAGRGNPAKALQAAASCGLAVQKAVRGMSVEGAKLEMRVGVSTGALWLLDYDVESRRETLFCGPAMEALSGLNICAEGVRLTDESVPLATDALKIVNDQFGPKVLSVTSAALSQTVEPIFDVSPWLRDHQRLSLSLGKDWSAEFRQAHVLFIRVNDFAFSGPDDLEAATARLRTIAKAVDGEGGALLQTCCDDKGLVAVAVWGLSSSQREDGAERAVRTAIAISADASATCAIAEGKVFSGLLGDARYAQHVVISDVINRAAAMCVTAAAPVSLDQATSTSVARRFETEAVAALRLKGQSEPAQVFAVTKERLRGLAHSGLLIGRTAERQHLRRLAGRIFSGETLTIRITAAAGMGKSRLADWFGDLLEDQGIGLSWVQADGLRQNISFSPFVPFLAQNLDMSEDATAEAWRGKLLSILPPDFHGDLPLLSPLLPVVIEDTPQTEVLIGAPRATRTTEIAAALVGRLLAGGTRVLVVEDVHWLDSASWLLLVELAMRSSVSICLVGRPQSPEDLPSEARRFLDPAQVETIELEMLNAEDSGALAAQTLGARAADRPLAELLYRETSGHPLFTASLVLALSARGLTPVSGGYAHLKLGAEGLSHLDIPSDAAGAVTEQISALSPGEQLTLRTGSVLGRRFDSATLAALHPNGDPTAVERDLERVAQTGLVEAMGTGTWRFHHAIIADAAYATLLSDQAKRLHALALAQIEARQVTSSDQGDIALMAYHAERAGASDMAIGYLDRAADAARGTYANLEVVDFLTRAIALSGDPSTGVDPVTVANWRYHIAYALRALGQYQRAEDFLKKCIGDLDKPPPESAGQATRGLLGGFAAFKLRPHLDEQPADLRAPIILAADATMMLSEIHYELNKIPFALAEILRGANLARAAGGDSSTLAKLYIGMALISTALPWALDGDDLQAKALAIADRLDDPQTEAWVYMVSGNYEAGKGGWARGERFFRHAMEVSDACGERKTWETSTSTLANLKRLEGWFEEAKGWSDVTLAASRDRGIVHGVIWSHNGRARDLLCLSLWDDMREDVAALAALLDDPANASDANDNNRLVFHYTRACLALDDGAEDEALAALKAAIDIVERTKRPQVYMTQNAPIYSDLIAALAKRGQDKDALIELQAHVVRSAKRIGKQYRAGVPMVGLTQGDAHWLQNDPRKAQKAWLASVEAAEERGMRFAAAQAYDRLTRHGLMDGREARDAHLAALGIEHPRLWTLSA